MPLNGLGRINVSGGKSLDQLKGYFFDRRSVLQAAERGQIKALSKFGAYVRRAAQTSMRRRKKGTSQPGQPPFAKQGQLRDLLFFAYDPLSKTVVVGPLGFRNSPVPSVHEYGGKLLVGPKKKKRYRTYPARPFMRPALKKTLPLFAKCFEGTVTR